MDHSFINDVWMDRGRDGGRDIHFHKVSNEYGWPTDKTCPKLTYGPKQFKMSALTELEKMIKDLQNSKQNLDETVIRFFHGIQIDETVIRFFHGIQKKY
jgi:hypothetical protein